jgi:hypothetical protein
MYIAHEFDSPIECLHEVGRLGDLPVSGGFSQVQTVEDSRYEYSQGSSDVAHRLEQN